MMNIHNIHMKIHEWSFEICRWFPQIVFTLLNRVRPINVGFSNCFFCLSDKSFLIIIIKKKIEEDEF